MSPLFEQIDLTVPGGDNVKQGFTKTNTNMTLLETWLKLGSGSPENVVAGYVGAVYLDVTNGTLYQKVTGSNTKTGWQSIAGTTLSSAQHFATSKTIAVSGNTLTLTEDSNIFVVSGTSTITNITGWTQGIAFVRWTQARTLTHNATSLILQNGQDRSVLAGDISIFEMSIHGAREVNYFPAQAPLITEYYVPYSVNSAYTDSDGYADFINKVSDTEVSFDIDDGTSYTSLVVTYPDGTVEETTSQANIDSGMATDGTYTFIKEKGSAIAVTANTITEGYTFPAAPSSGDYHLDISVKPYKPYKYDGASWIETQFVKLGEVTKTSGTLGTPISYAFNGFYDSGWFNYPGNNTTFTKNHNLGLEGDLYDEEIIAKLASARNGYQENDVVKGLSDYRSSSNNIRAGFARAKRKNSIVKRTEDYTSFLGLNGSDTELGTNDYLKIVVRRTF